MSRPLTVLSLLALGACDLPSQQSRNLGELWDPYDVRATSDGLYVALPRAGALAMVSPDEDPFRVDVGHGAVGGLTVGPDGHGLLAMVERVHCKDPDPVTYVADCDDPELRYELVHLLNGEAGASIDVDAPYNTFAWGPEARHVIAWLAFEDLAEVPGVVNLNSVVVLDLDEGIPTSVPVGFAARQALFTPDGDKAVVLSQNRVAVIDLSGPSPANAVTFPLTLTPDQVVEPVGADLTPDGRYALISAQGTDDLYILDLQNPSVNMASLSAPPAAMVVDHDADRTVLVYPSRAYVDLLDHQFFNIQSLALHSPMRDILEGDGFVLLSSPTSRDVYRLSLPDGELVRFRLQADTLSLHLAPTQEYAIAFTREGTVGNRPGMEILDLRDDRGRTAQYLLESRGVGVAFAAEADSLHALILQAHANYVYQLDLYSGRNEKLDLAEAPAAVGSIDDHLLYVTHEAPLGLVTFLDPRSGDSTLAEGFATFGLLDPQRVLED